MKELVATIYRKSGDLPEMEYRNFFHSKSLFMIYEQTPRQTPYMVVVRTCGGNIVGHLLAVIRQRTSCFPPYIYRHCRIMGEGEYAGAPHEACDIFAEAIRVLTQEIQGHVLYTELSHLGQKMFGYGQLRRNYFFPVHWMSIHNSLHSHTPEERLSEKMKRRIETASAKGVVTREATGEDELKACCRLLRDHNLLKPKRYIPDDSFFKALVASGHGRIFATVYKDTVIGCCVCAYSGSNAYLWYSAFRRKTFIMLHPDILTVWQAIKDAHERGFAHIEFMDVGLPLRKNPFRDFILRFGGKPVSTYRWFRFSPRWLNRILSNIYIG